MSLDRRGDVFRKIVHVHPSSPFIATIPDDGSGRHQPKTARSSSVTSTSVCPGGMNCGDPIVRRL
jgi:hypothetical protein